MLQLIGPDGKHIKLQCAVYHGFNNGQTMLDGQWVGNSSSTQDYSTVLYRIQACCQQSLHRSTAMHAISVLLQEAVKLQQLHSRPTSYVVALRLAFGSISVLSPCICAD